MRCNNCGRILKMDLVAERWRHDDVQEAMKECKNPEPSEGDVDLPEKI